MCDKRKMKFYLLCNRKDLVKIMRESSFLLHKRSAKDAHTAIK
ncbi:hypothetical protein RUMHYD_01129 [Blautia hydrogenotrophica DSM 10507]|uniref:Uncharacterized protein n=1 Tax=Blautia hydrogenotrophica (strain DSM 10507 / JCM 14656 / S5a33) TaxID=476272 RepID=C0CJV9_BLAHS|nr:hypothetical protein RUMHYD_01129 [Blautia hydrogenotrophica DSM 10507]